MKKYEFKNKKIEKEIFMWIDFLLYIRTNKEFYQYINKFSKDEYMSLLYTYFQEFKYERMELQI